MNATVHSPDELAARLAAEGGDLDRRALEGLALAEYHAGRLTLAELRRMLGLSRYELDGFLKAHGVVEAYSLEDLEQERQTLDVYDNAPQGPADDRKSTPSAPAAEGKALTAAFREFRRGRTLGGLDPKALIHDGLR